jgi:peptide-methionine (S)-S-oxide reductase
LVPQQRLLVRADVLAIRVGERQTVSSGTTGHAESVKVTFDPKQISYGKILQIYFSVAHNPTELNYQG